MLTCDNCGQPLHTDDASILWQDHVVNGRDTVLAFLIVHQACDNGDYQNSAGAVYGSDWHPDTHGTNCLAGKSFALSSDEDAFEALITQRRKDYTGS
jgi:hypothetical protein